MEKAYRLFKPSVHSLFTSTCDSFVDVRVQIGDEVHMIIKLLKRHASIKLAILSCIALISNIYICFRARSFQEGDSVIHNIFMTLQHKRELTKLINSAVKHPKLQTISALHLQLSCQPLPPLFTRQVFQWPLVGLWVQEVQKNPQAFMIPNTIKAYFMPVPAG